MDNFYSNLNEETKVKLALSYENGEIIEKFAVENTIDSELAKEYFMEVKKFLYLCSVSNETLAPSPEIDKIWHTFILFTKEYRFYCLNFLGKFIDHVPQVKKTFSKENYLLNTIIIYEKTFGCLNNEVWQIRDNANREQTFDYDANCSLNFQSECSSCCESQEHSCVFTGNCFDCTDSGQSCVGENPNNL